jgi:alpha-methylacyl-CoA racemase
MGLLDGVRVLDLASVGPAARASRLLADYGADVVKVAPVARRGGKQIQPPFHTYGAGRGLRRARVDLQSAAGRDAFLRLVATADVVIESYRPGVAARLGVGWDDVRRVNPRAIYCSTSGYGQDGPAAGWAGHDLNYLGVGGLLACGEPRADGGPALPGATVADAAGGGMHAVIAILAALLERERTGEGRRLDVAATEGVLSIMSLAVDQYLATGEVAGPRQVLLTGRYACYDLYPARDGRWLAVAAIEPVFFANLCRALGCEEWIPHQSDAARQAEIRAAFRGAFVARDRDAWIEALAPADTCVAPVQSIAEAARDPQLAARGAFAEALHPGHGRFRQLAPLLAGQGGGAGSVPDPAETQTAALLREAGLAAEEIEKLSSEGVVA